MNRKSFLRKLLIGIPAVIISPSILESLKNKTDDSFHLKICESEVVPFKFELAGISKRRLTVAGSNFEDVVYGPDNKLWTIIVDNRASN